MSKFRDILTADKTDLTFGNWSDEKLKHKDFPLRRSAYPLTRRWRWQVITFRSNGKRFRILSAYHTLVPEYLAILAEDTVGDSRIVARWEFHQSHAGWHIHACCTELDNITVGIVHPLGVKRIPTAKNSHRRALFLNEGFSINDSIATEIACRRYKLPHTLDLINSAAMP